MVRPKLPTASNPRGPAWIRSGARVEVSGFSPGLCLVICFGEENEEEGYLKGLLEREKGFVRRRVFDGGRKENPATGLTIHRMREEGKWKRKKPGGGFDGDGEGRREREWRMAAVKG
ncbi:hypothetical protein HAX54_038847 [Datura stramonium]|uniref:Uncharacterized protein n=1 Tax=Datura stramonium TaxID=4076 RepID=A0ABS8VPE2_DATST|nr:hypothetical protein [Datura stramonium]